MQTSFVFFFNGKIIKGISLFTFRNWYKFNTCSYNNIIAHQYCHHVFILEIEGVLELDCPRYKYERRKRNILTLLNSADVPVVYQTFLIKILPSLGQL